MLTRKQNELLLFINKRLNDGGVSPSFDEMKEALRLKSKFARALKPPGSTFAIAVSAVTRSAA